jgi:hypothetical protein
MAVGAALLSGCARFPADPGVPDVARLTFRMTVDREINPNFVYIVALRPSTDRNPIDQGPVPVVAPPWGNGFVAGSATHFVRWDPLQSPNYVLYRFRDQTLNEWFQIGVPINWIDVEPQGRTLVFEIDLAQLAPSPAEALLLESLQVNFLTMDRVPQGTLGGQKRWDALGNSLLPSEVNQWVTIPLRTSGVYDNARFNALEPRGDTPDPDLDIVDWSIEVRLQ